MNIKQIIPSQTIILGSLAIWALALLSVDWGLMSSGDLLGASAWLSREERIPVDLTGTLYTVDGEAIDLKTLEKGVLFLNFWATWCGPCRAEMPSIASLHEEMEKQGVQVVAVTDEDPATVRAYLQRNPYPFTVLVDKGGQLTNRLRIWSLPWTLILDKDGKLVHFHQGARQWDTPDVIQKLMELSKE